MRSACAQSLRRSSTSRLRLRDRRRGSAQPANATASDDQPSAVPGEPEELCVEAKPELYSGAVAVRKGERRAGVLGGGEGEPVVVGRPRQLVGFVAEPHEEAA